MRILITGCSTGIGRALAIELTRRGHGVIATARKPEVLADLAVEMKLPLDVTQDESVQAAIAAAGPIDVLVNNAGIGIWAPVETTPFADVRHLYETNFFGMVRMTRAVLPQMRARRNGIVLQVSSAGGKVPMPLVGFYASSKAAMEALSASLRVELLPFNVRVAVLGVGAVATAFVGNRLTLDAPDYQPLIEHIRKRLAGHMAQPATAESVAVTVADIIDSGAPQLRYDVTPDSAAAVARRAGMSDAAWEQELLAGFPGLPPI